MPESLGPHGCPYDPGAVNVSNRPIDVRTVTIHRTIGSWAGDYNVGKNRNLQQGTFQWLVGQDEGQWVQFYPADRFASHAAGANNAGPGIELSGQNGEPLTAWQTDALGRITRWLHDEWGVDDVYVDGDPREWIDNVDARGFVSHRHVAYPPDPSLEHYDYITDTEFVQAYLPPLPPVPEDDEMSFTATDEDNQTWIFSGCWRHQISWDQANYLAALAHPIPYAGVITNLGRDAFADAG